MSHDSSRHVADVEGLVRQHEPLVGRPERLGERIELLRRLRDRDWENPRWAAELAGCEEEHKAALFAELGGLASRSERLAEEAVRRAEAIHALLASPSWCEPLHGDDILRAQTLLGQVGRARADAIIDELVPQLESVRAAGDWERARALVAELEPCWRRAGRDSDGEAWRAFEACRRWVDDRLASRVAARARDTALESVRAACRSPVSWSLPGLIRNRDRIKAALNQMILVPGILESDEAAIVAADAQAAQRRVAVRIGLLFVSGAACVCLMVLAGAVALVTARQAWSRDRVVAATRETVLGHAQAHRLPAARDAWRKAADSHPWMSAHPLRAEVEGLFTELEHERERDNADAEGLVGRAAERLRGPCTDAVGDLRHACGQEPVCTRDVLAARKRCDRELAETTAAVEAAAARLAAVEARWGEQASFAAASALEEVRRGTQSLASEAVELVGRAHASWFQRMRERLERLEREPEPGGEDARAEMQDILGQIAEAEASGRRVPHDVRHAIAALEARFRSAARLAIVRRELDAASRTGSDAVMRALQAAADSEGDAVAAGLQRVVRAAPAIEAAESWARVAREWRADLRVDDVAATRWGRAIDAALKAPLRPAAGPGAMAQVEQLRAALTERADAPIRVILEPLADCLKSRIMQPGVLCVMNGERRFYTIEDADGRRFVDEDTLVRRGGFDSTAAVAAAHLALARSMRETIAEMIDGRVDPDEGIAGLLQACVDESLVGETDRLLLCRIVQGVVELAAQRHLFAPAKADLEAIEFGIRSRVGKQPRWVDPEQWSTLQAWRNALQVARDAVPSREQVENIVAVYAARRTALGRRPEFCEPLDFAGWVDFPAGRPVVRLRSGQPPGAPGRLYVVRLIGDAGWTLEEVGQVDGSEVALKPNAALEFGQPVHAVWRR